MVDELNAGKPQCPVGLNTLVLPRKSTLPPPDQTPYVIWNAGTSRATTTGVKKEEKTGLARYALKWARFPIVYGSGASLLGGSRTTYLRFQSVRSHGFRENSQVTNDFFFYILLIAQHFYDSTRYWGAIPIPHGTNGFIGKCPFCATPLEDRGFAKLIFQDHLDS